MLVFIRAQPNQERHTEWRDIAQSRQLQKKKEEEEEEEEEVNNYLYTVLHY